MSCIKFQCDIDIKENPLHLDINNFVSTALRDNKKRKFLFISKDLGKHLPVKPNKVLELGYLLAKVYKMKYQDDKKTAVISFAETATCLGHSFFEKMKEAEIFIHTTREDIKTLERIDFKEEHSHATEQILYYSYIKNDIDKIILVDDEITTAKTCLNMIKILKDKCNVKKYVIVSILNWIDEKREKEIIEKAAEFGCEIEFSYLFRGTFNFNLESENLKDNIEMINENVNKKPIIKYINLDFEEYILNKKYLKYTGRFGIDRQDQEKLKDLIKRESKKLNDKEEDCKILALGVEEFMYIPLLLSREIKGDVYYHSITRSPIIPSKENEDYDIKSKYSFLSLYNDNINYLYNLNVENYEECFIFIEFCKDKKRLDALINIMSSLGIKKINIVQA